MKDLEQENRKLKNDWLILQNKILECYNATNNVAYSHILSIMQEMEERYD